MERVTPMEILLAILGGGVGVAIVEAIKTIVLRKIDKKNDKQSDIAELVKTLVKNQRMILYIEIKALCKRHCAAGEIASDDLEDVMEMHNVYHKLGGNGYLDNYMEQVKTLKII